MADSKPWKFAQTAGDRKVLVLAGPSAPHGRPRASTVVEDEMALRDTAVYYPGNRRPTRHLFGEIHTDWTLTGRFSDSFLGAGGARARVLEIKEFIADQQEVRIEWGDILAATGILRRIKPARESESEIAWTLTIGIDGDDALPCPAPARSVGLPTSSFGKLEMSLDTINKLKARPMDISFPTDFLDTLDELVSVVGSVTGSVVGIAHDIDNFEKAAVGELNRLRAAVRQLQTAALQLHATLESAQTDFAFESSSARSEGAWHASRAEAVAEAFAMLAMLADTDRALEILEQGRTTETRRAAAGDSWESLSTRHYGGPAKADLLRKANGARYGQQPQAGRIVRVPRA